MEPVAPNQSNDKQFAFPAKNSGSFASKKILSVVGIAVIIGLVGYVFFLARQKAALTKPTPKAQASITPQPTVDNQAVIRNQLRTTPPEQQVIKTTSVFSRYKLLILNEAELLPIMHSIGGLDELCQTLITASSPSCKTMVINFVDKEVPNPLYTYTNNGLGFTVTTALNETKEAYTMTIAIAPRTFLEATRFIPSPEVQRAFFMTLARYAGRNKPKLEADQLQTKTATMSSSLQQQVKLFVVIGF